MGDVIFHVTYSQSPRDGIADRDCSVLTVAKNDRPICVGR